MQQVTIGKARTFSVMTRGLVTRYSSTYHNLPRPLTDTVTRMCWLLFRVAKRDLN